MEDQDGKRRKEGYLKVIHYEEEIHPKDLRSLFH